MQHAIVLLMLAMLFSSAHAVAPDKRYTDKKCERVDAKLEKINSQLRAGASTKAAQRLKSKRRDLKLERSRHCNP